MASKFGLLGDITNQLQDIRRDVQMAASNVHNVKDALANAELTPELVARLVAILDEAQGKLDGLLGR